MDDLVMVSLNGFVGDGPRGTQFDLRFRYDPAQPPIRVEGNRAVYDIDDPEAVLEFDGNVLGPIDITLAVTDNLNVENAGILFVDSLEIDAQSLTSEPFFRLDVRPVTNDLGTFVGTGLPEGLLLLDAAGTGAAELGESTLDQRLLLPGFPGFLDAPLTDFKLGRTFPESGPAGEPEVTQLTTSEARLVARLFEIGLDRNGQLAPEGINHWIDFRERGRTEEQLANAFLDSQEFADAFGDPLALTPREFVETLFRNGLDRPGAEEGIVFWTNALAQPGFSRGDLLIEFADSIENRDVTQSVERLVEVEPGFWDLAG